MPAQVHDRRFRLIHRSDESLKIASADFFLFFSQGLPMSMPVTENHDSLEAAIVECYKVQCSMLLICILFT